MATRWAARVEAGSALLEEASIGQPEGAWKAGRRGEERHAIATQSQTTVNRQKRAMRRTLTRRRTATCWSSGGGRRTASSEGRGGRAAGATAGCDCESSSPGPLKIAGVRDAAAFPFGEHCTVCSWPPSAMVVCPTPCFTMAPRRAAAAPPAWQVRQQGLAADAGAALQGGGCLYPEQDHL